MQPLALILFLTTVSPSALPAADPPVMIRSSVAKSPWPLSWDSCVAVRITRSPTRQPVTGSASVTVMSPALAVSPSLTQVRLIGAPCRSMRPPQQTIAGHDCRSIPSM